VQRGRLGLRMDHTFHCHLPFVESSRGEGRKASTRLEATHSPPACPHSCRELSRKSHAAIKCS
jgi:hypothetical protein